MGFLRPLCVNEFSPAEGIEVLYEEAGLKGRVPEKAVALQKKYFEFFVSVFVL